MEINTASEVIACAGRLEKESADFYQALSKKFGRDADVFESFAKENVKYVTQVERTYYEVITDALEACFAYGMNSDEFSFDTALVGEVSYAEALRRAIQIEHKIAGFYEKAAEQSKSLLADVPRTFTIIAGKRAQRQSKLKLLLSSITN